MASAPSPPPRPRRSSTGEMTFTAEQIKNALTKLRNLQSATPMEVSPETQPTTSKSAKRPLEIDSEGFQTISKQPRKGKSASKKTHQTSTVAPVPVGNRFAPIAKQSTSSQDPTPPEPKPRRPPPIILDSTLYSTALLVNRLRGLGIQDFRVQSTRSNIKIFLQSDADFVKTRDYLASSHQTTTPVYFHTFAPRGSKPNQKFLIIGLDEEHPIDSIKQAIIHPDLIDVRRLVTTVDGERVETPNVLVTFQPNYKYESHLKLIRSIDHVLIRHKPFISNQGTPTCQNCQGLGHTKRYCWRPIRCVRCSKNHKASECDPATPPKCSNCGQAHVASYKLCPYRQQILAARTASKPPQPAPKPVPRNPPPPPPSVWALPPQPASRATPALSTSQPNSKIPVPTQPAPVQHLHPAYLLPEPDTTPRWVHDLTKSLTGMIESLMATVNSLLAALPLMQAK